MKDENIRKLRELATALLTARKQHLGGYVLFIGGETSIIGGHPAIDELRRQVLLTNPELGAQQLGSLSLTDQMLRFDQALADWGPDPIIAKWQELHENLTPTKGHMALASLLKENYIRLVLTSTIDQLMESVFISSTVSLGRPLHQWSVLVNGRDTQQRIHDRIQDAISSETIFLKLCGDMKLDTFAVTQSLVQQKIQDIQQVLASMLRNRSLIIVGFTPLDDLMIQHFPAVGGRVIFIGREEPANVSQFAQHHWTQPPMRIIDPDLTFDLVFQTIAQRLNTYQEYEETTGTTLNKETVERFEEEIQKQKTQQPTTPKSQTSQDELITILRSEQGRDKKPETGKASHLFRLVEPTILTVSVDKHRQVSFDVIGDTLNYASKTPTEWHEDINKLNASMQDLGQNLVDHYQLRNQQDQLRNQEGLARWQRQAEREGERFYQDLIGANADLDRKLVLARETAVEDNPRNLTLVFNGPRESLGMPYELLHDGKAPLAVSHPLCRTVDGVKVQHAEDESFEAFVRSLRPNPGVSIRPRSQQPDEQLRVLLVASNADSTTADQEISQVHDKITKQASITGLSVDCEVLPAEKASLKEVKKRLERCTYHIVHYAGPCSFDEADGKNSGLRFWQETNGRKEEAIVSANDLRGWLAGSQVRLFYLSSNIGAWIRSQQLQENEYMGMMDAIVQAGIPYVFGFRWHVPSSASLGFAESFYQHLFTRPMVPERAVWYARREIYNLTHGTNETPLSPILVAQKPYGKKKQDKST